MARTTPAGYLARRIETLRAGGMTRGQIAAATGIGERTQRKLISGQTSGRRLITAQIKGSRAVRRGRERGTLAILVQDPSGRITSVDIIAPRYEGYRRLSPLDQAILAASPAIKTVVESELQRKRGGSARLTDADIAASRIVGSRVINRAHYAGIPLVAL